MIGAPLTNLIVFECGVRIKSVFTYQCLVRYKSTIRVELPSISVRTGEMPDLMQYLQEYDHFG
jgi:hypothetical protein